LNHVGRLRVDRSAVGYQTRLQVGRRGDLASLRAVEVPKLIGGRTKEVAQRLHVPELRLEGAGVGGLAELVVHAEAAGEVVVELEADRLGVDRDAVEQRRVGARSCQRVDAGHRSVELGILGVHRGVVAGQRLEAAELGAVQGGAAEGLRRRRRVLVEHLEVHAEVALAAVELLGDVALELVALQRVVAVVAGALAFAEVAADVEVQVGRELAAVVAVEARLVVAETSGQADAATGRLAGAADVVDDRARRVRCEHRRRTAAQRLDAVDVVVEADPVVVVREVHVPELHGRQTVFLELNVLRAAGGDRQTAHRDVRVAGGAGGGVGAYARNHQQHFGFGAGTVILDLFLIDVGDRHRTAQLGLGLAGGGDDDALQVADVGGLCARAGRRGGLLRQRRGGEGTGKSRRRHERGDARQGGSAGAGGTGLLHQFSSMAGLGR
jgi:hypothetical protein